MYLTADTFVSAAIGAKTAVLERISSHMLGVIGVRERHITFVISITGAAQVSMDSWMETPSEYRGCHIFSKQIGRTRYHIRLIGVNGWLLPEWANQQAAQLVQNFLQAKEVARR